MEARRIPGLSWVVPQAGFVSGMRSFGTGQVVVAALNGFACCRLDPHCLLAGRALVGDLQILGGEADGV